MKNLKKWKNLGVNFLVPTAVFISPETDFSFNCFIGINVIIQNDSKINENTYINNSQIINCQIGKNCVINGCFLQNTKIEDNCTIINSVIKDSIIKANNNIGPFAYLRQNAKINENCRIGDFVEIKNSTLGQGTKCAHLCYVGDATVGINCNLGCGSVFANFNGKEKFKTKVGNNCFIGANVNLVAPIEIGDNCYISAGATVRKNLPFKTFLKTEEIQKQIENLRV